MTLRFLQDRKVADPLLGVFSNGMKQGLKVSGHSPHGGGVKQVGTVCQRTPQALFGLSQREREQTWSSE